MVVPGTRGSEGRIGVEVNKFDEGGEGERTKANRKQEVNGEEEHRETQCFTVTDLTL